jgi:hypothetical protein
MLLPTSLHKNSMTKFSGRQSIAGSPDMQTEVQLKDDMASSHSDRPFPSFVTGLS